MKNDKIVPGVILVLIGAAILLANFGWLQFHWYNIFHLWPVFLVIAGVNLVFANNKTVWASAIKIGVVVAGIGLILFGNFGDRYNFWPRYNYSFNNDDNSDDNNHDSDDDNDDNDSTDMKATSGSNFNEPYKPGIKMAQLNISGGGTTYNLADTTNQLFSAATGKDDNRYLMTSSNRDSTYVVNFKMKNQKGFNFDSDNNRVEFKINPNPIWSIDVEAGATKLDFDLSKYKVKRLDIKGGAAAFDIKMGAPLEMTDVEISTGVSSVNISIPQNAACSIETESGLSDNHFEGFNKTRDNNFETPDFAAAKNKMHIHISGGLSGFNVNRY